MWSEKKVTNTKIAMIDDKKMDYDFYVQCPEKYKSNPRLHYLGYGYIHQVGSHTYEENTSTGHFFINTTAGNGKNSFSREFLDALV